jgi:hypothetical protein
MRVQQQQQNAATLPAGGVLSSKHPSNDFQTPSRSASKETGRDGVKFSFDEPELEKKNSKGGDADLPSSPTTHSGTSSVPNSATKRYQRLTSKSFMGGKGHASTSSSMARASAEAMARVKSSNPNTPFAIIHGKIVPIHSTADSDAKLKSEMYAQYIREYAQSHCVNPFRIKDSQSYTHSQTHNRRRWVHVFPQGTPSSTFYCYVDVCNKLFFCNSFIYFSFFKF